MLRYTQDRERKTEIGGVRVSIDEKQLEELARELRNEYHRNLNKKNREKKAEANRRYWIKKAKEKLESENNV